MIPKDLKTNSVDASAAFEQGRARQAIRESGEDDYDYSEFENKEDEEEENDIYDWETCNCSDPGCPCYGNKKGCL
jgi:hypothetical protein